MDTETWLTLREQEWSSLPSTQKVEVEAGELQQFLRLVRERNSLLDQQRQLAWHDLRTEAPPTGDRPVVIFPMISDVGHRFTVRRDYHVSNPEYVRLHALQMGYTHWFPVPPHPDEAAIEGKIAAIYQSENDGREQWSDGFERAAENIAEALEQLVPDRPAVAQVIRDRFVDHGRKEGKIDAFRKR